MKRKIIFVTLVLVALALAFVMTNDNSVSVSAKPNDTYTIDWYTIDGGGAMNLTGGAYSLSGTTGQFDAGSQSGGAYSLNAGFWSFNVADIIKTYLPMISK
jgi:hypothetical protein